MSKDKKINNIKMERKTKFPIMHSAFTEMLKAGKQVWMNNIRRNPKADFNYGFDQLFRYYILT